MTADESDTQPKDIEGASTHPQYDAGSSNFKKAADKIIEEIIDEHIMESSTPDLKRQIRLLACFFGFIFSIVTVILKGFGINWEGDGVFVMIVSGLTFLAISPPQVKQVGKELANPFRVLFRAFFNSLRTANWRKLGLVSAELVRSLFRFGDRIVRFLLIVIAIGGTAVCVKYGITNFHMLPAFLEVWVKRFGPALALIVVTLYPSFLISKRIFFLDINKHDKACAQYEMAFYVSSVMLCVTILTIFSGVPVENFYILRSSRNNVSFVWNDYQLQVLVSLSVIWLIWLIALGSSIVSRFLEIAWRDRPSR